MTMPRIVITGSGAVCAAGMDPAAILAAVLEGRSAIGPIKQWDTTAFRILPVTNFVAVLPVAVAELPASSLSAESPLLPSEMAGAPATNAQVAELADELLVYHGETRATQNAIIAALVVIVDGDRAARRRFHTE
mgnify:CR=1 FL=1